MALAAQHCADWGMTAAPVAHAVGLGFLPFVEEHYDVAPVTARMQRPSVQAFGAVGLEGARTALERAGFRPA